MVIYDGQALRVRQGRPDAAGEQGRYQPFRGRPDLGILQRGPAEKDHIIRHTAGRDLFLQESPDLTFGPHIEAFQPLFSFIYITVEEALPLISQYGLVGNLRQGPGRNLSGKIPRHGIHIEFMQMRQFERNLLRPGEAGKISGIRDILPDQQAADPAQDLLLHGRESGDLHGFDQDPCQHGRKAPGSIHHIKDLFHDRRGHDPPAYGIMQDLEQIGPVLFSG